MPPRLGGRPPSDRDQGLGRLEHNGVSPTNSASLNNRCIGSHARIIVTGSGPQNPIVFRQVALSQGGHDTAETWAGNSKFHFGADRQ